mmetsp:Transcript_34609/g.69916  ORF Transcript_34609/g.69916 Transcript_34609/m.69916 type:complete len:547 (+) Transcript_34609:105-1745(+)
MASCRAAEDEEPLPEPDYGHLAATGSNDNGFCCESSSLAAAPAVAGIGGLAATAHAEATEYILGTLVVRVAAAKYLVGNDDISIGRLLWASETTSSAGGAAKKKKWPPSRRHVCPYARLAFGGNSQRTTVCYNSTDPEWSREEQYYFDVTLPVPKLAHFSGGGSGGDIGDGKAAVKGTIFEGPDDRRNEAEGWSSIPPPPRPLLTISLFHSEAGKGDKAKESKAGSKDQFNDDICLGTLSLDVTQVLTGKTRQFDRWIPLGGGGNATGEVRIVCEYDSADPPPRHGDLCRFTGFCDPADLYPAPASEVYRVDDLDGDDVVLSYTSPEGWLCTFKAHRYMLICAVRHQAAIERYEAEIIEIVQKLAQSPVVHTIKETVDRLPDDGLINVGRDALVGGVGLLNRWLDGGVDLAVQDIVYATNWDGRHNTNAVQEEEDSSDGSGSHNEDNEAEREAYEQEDDGTEPLPGMPCCPITGQPMRDPVVAADGHSYERKAIIRWFRESDKSPITGVALAHKHVVPNYMLLSALQKDSSDNHIPTEQNAVDEGD